MTTTNQIVLPAPPARWEWRTRPLTSERPGRDVAYRLVAPDGWATKEYSADPERAMAEAQRRILSQPREAAQVVVLAVSENVLAPTPAIEAEAGGAVAFRYDELGTEERITVLQLAREINDALDEIELRGLRVGSRLVEVRQRLPRGTWRAWLATECPRISFDTAENLILKARLAARTPKLSALEGMFAPTAITRLARPSVPDTAIDEAIRRAEAGEYLTVASAEEIIRAEKAAVRLSPPHMSLEAAHRPAEAATGATGAIEAIEAHRPAEAATGASANLTDPSSQVEQALAALTVVEAEIAAGRIAEARAALTRLELAVLGWSEEQQSPVLEQITAIRLQWGKTFLTHAPTPPPANSVGLWRTPYGAPGSGRWHPIVPAVLVTGSRRDWFAPAPISRSTVSYETASQVRVEVEGRTTSLGTQNVWCVPDDSAWSEITAAHQRFSVALAVVAARCRELGRYDRRLAEAGGMAQAANPLTPWVIRYTDPDDPPPPSYSLSDWQVQSAGWERAVRHTPKMLVCRDSLDRWDTTSAQHQFFLCPNEATWAAFQADVAAATVASEAFLAVLKHYGTYKAAIEDGRYTDGVPVEQARAVAPATNAKEAVAAEEPRRAAETSTRASDVARTVEEPGRASRAATVATGAASTIPGVSEAARAAIAARAAAEAREDVAVAAARRVYGEIVGRLSLDHLGLIAASLWTRADLAWYAAQREELERAVVEYWTVGLAEGLYDDEGIAQTVRRVGLKLCSPAAEACPAVAQPREEPEEVNEHAEVERLLSSVEALIAQGAALPFGCEADLARCEALMQTMVQALSDETWDALVQRITAARSGLREIAEQMGLTDEE